MASLADLLRSGDNNAVVSDIYRNMLGREADPSAYAWAGELNSDDPNSIANLARRISASEEAKTYSAANPDSQWNYLESISKEGAPTAAFDTSGMQYLGSNNYMDRAGNTVQMDENGNAISYKPSASWYDEQLKSNPNALRGLNYRNQTYLASGPLQQTMNFQGKEIPMELAEYQVDPQTGKFIKGATGENVPVRMKDKEYNMWDDWATPVAVVALPALMAGGAYAAGAYGAGAAGGTLGAEGAGALTTTELLGGAGGSFVPTAGTGASFTLPAGATAATSSGFAGISPELAAELGLEGSSSGLSGTGASGDVLANMGIESTSGLSNMQKAQLVRSGINSLSSGVSNGAQIGGGGSGGGNYNYANMPFLANPQNNQTYMKTGADVSGSGITTAGMPVQLDTTRHNLLMANLLRG